MKILFENWRQYLNEVEALKYNDEEDFYRVVLGAVPEDKAEFTKLYRMQALKHHPDRGGDQSKFQELVTAKSVWNRKGNFEFVGRPGSSRPTGPSRAPASSPPRPPADKDEPLLASILKKVIAVKDNPRMTGVAMSYVNLGVRNKAPFPSGSLTDEELDYLTRNKEKHPFLKTIVPYFSSLKDHPNGYFIRKKRSTGPEQFRSTGKSLENLLSALEVLQAAGK